MIIALDARTVFARQRRGTGKNLLDLYLALSALREEWRFVLLHQVDVEPDAKLSALLARGNVRARRIDIPGDCWDLWRRIRLPLGAAGCGATLLHCPANLAAGPGRTPQVVTIHDLIPLDARFNPDQRSREAWLKQLRSAAARARLIITPSEFSQKQIEQILPRAADKVHVNPWAADSACARVDDADALARVRDKYGVAADRCEGGFVLALGGADPRKNTGRMLGSWALMPAERRRRTHLLIVGVQDAVLAKYRSAAAELGIGESCTVGGFADEADMAALISAAEILYYPSLSEGFGLPVLDGFACGTPVVCSNVTSLPEVAGDAALMADPTDEEALAAALERVLDDKTLAGDLVRRGRERLARFTWEACAARAAELFEKAAAGL